MNHQDNHHLDIPAVPKTSSPNTPSSTAPAAPAFDPEVFGGDTCDLCQCCLNPVGFAWNKASDSLDRGVTTLQELLYITVCYGGWTIIFLYTYPAIDASHNVASYHKLVGVVVGALCVTTWRLAKTTSPGNITAATLHVYDNYVYDGILYPSPAILCPTLQIRKLARSKYNRYSGTHVPRFDHHCHVLNQAVGECNYRYFLVFLWIHATVCFYGMVTVSRLVWEQVVVAAVLSNQPQEHGGHPVLWVTQPLTVGTAGLRLVALWGQDPFMTIFALAMGVVGVALACFLGFHLQLIGRGMTTNEYYKWKELLKKHAITTHNSNSNNSNNECRPLNNNHDDEEECIHGASSLSIKSYTTTTTTSHGSQRFANAYDRGVASNIWEVCFPRCNRPVGKKRD